MVATVVVADRVSESWQAAGLLEQVSGVATAVEAEIAGVQKVFLVVTAADVLPWL